MITKFVIILPLLLFIFLYCLSFSTDTSQLISLFLSFVWGIMFSLGGSIMFLKRHEVENSSGLLAKFNSNVNKNITIFSLVLIGHSLLFLLLSLLYPAKSIIYSKIENTVLGVHLPSFVVAYDSALFSLIIVPSVGSILVGGWCLSKAMNSVSK